MDKCKNLQIFYIFFLESVFFLEVGVHVPSLVLFACISTWGVLRKTRLNQSDAALKGGSCKSLAFPDFPSSQVSKQSKQYAFSVKVY